MRLLGLCLLFCMGLVGGELSNLTLESEAAILIDADTGRILYEKNARKREYPASTTKVATALYLIERSKLDMKKICTVDQDSVGWLSAAKKEKSGYKSPAYWLEPGATHIALKVDEEVSVQDLFYGMMLASGDDCSNILAKQAQEQGSIPKFCEEMNAYLRKEVGCKDTQFKNPHGLFHPDHYTTAHDLAMIAKRAMRSPLFRKVVASTSYTRESGGSTAVIAQGNKLLLPGKYYYKHAIGIKTGYIAKAKHNVVAAAKKDGRTLIAVLMHCEKRPQLFKETAELFDAAFKKE
jgi:D-alanyl-D-alanine carboxypeptidase (penicillin-binding protein 5/6)